MRELLKLNIQFFADETETTETAESQETEVTEQTEQSEADIELQKKIEAESDRKLAKALEKKEKEWQAKQQEAIQKALEEKERLSKLSEKEQKEEQLTKREQEIADRLKELERKELRSDAVADLSEKGLPSSFADFLLAEDAEKTLENINSFKGAFDEAVNARVKESLRQNTPDESTSDMTEDVFQQKLKKYK